MTSLHKQVVEALERGCYCRDLETTQCHYCELIANLRDHAIVPVPELRELQTMACAGRHVRSADLKPIVSAMLNAIEEDK